MLSTGLHVIPLSAFDPPSIYLIRLTANISWDVLCNYNTLLSSEESFNFDTR